MFVENDSKDASHVLVGTERHSVSTLTRRLTSIVTEYLPQHSHHHKADNGTETAALLCCPGPTLFPQGRRITSDIRHQSFMSTTSDDVGCGMSYVDHGDTVRLIIRDVRVEWCW